MSNLIRYNNKEELSGYCIVDKTRTLFENPYTAEVCATGAIFRNEPQLIIRNPQPPFRQGGYTGYESGYYSHDYPSFGHVVPPILELKINRFDSDNFCTDCEENIGTYSGWYNGESWIFDFCKPEKKHPGCNIVGAIGFLGFNSGDAFSYTNNTERDVYLFLNFLALQYPFSGNVDSTANRFTHLSRPKLTLYEKSYKDDDDINTANDPLSSQDLYYTIGTKAKIVGSMKYSNIDEPFVSSGFCNSNVMSTGWNNLSLDQTVFDKNWGCDLDTAELSISAKNDANDFNNLYTSFSNFSNYELYKGCSVYPYAEFVTRDVFNLFDTYTINLIDPSGYENIIDRETINGIQYRSLKKPLTQEIEITNSSGLFNVNGNHIFNSIHLTHPIASFIHDDYDTINYRTIHKSTYPIDPIYPAHPSLARYVKLFLDYNLAPSGYDRIDPYLCSKFLSGTYKNQLDIFAMGFNIFDGFNINESGCVLFDIYSSYDNTVSNGTINRAYSPSEYDLFLRTPDNTGINYIARFSGDFSFNDYNSLFYFNKDIVLNNIYEDTTRTQDRIFLNNTNITLKAKSNSAINKPCLTKDNSNHCEGAKLPDYLSVNFNNVHFSDGILNQSTNYKKFISNNPDILAYKGYIDWTVAPPITGVVRWESYPFSYQVASGSPIQDAIPYYDCSGCISDTYGGITSLFSSYIPCSNLTNTKPNGTYILEKGFIFYNSGTANNYQANDCILESKCTLLRPNESGIPVYFYKNDNWENVCDWKYIVATIDDDFDPGQVRLSINYPHVNPTKNCSGDTYDNCFYGPNKNIKSTYVTFSGEFPVIGLFDNNNRPFYYRDCSTFINMSTMSNVNNNIPPDTGIYTDGQYRGNTSPFPGVPYYARFNPCLHDIVSIGGGLTFKEKNHYYNTHPVFLSGNPVLIPYYN
jgi:hypothetical protein